MKGKYKARGAGIYSRLMCRGVESVEPVIDTLDNALRDFKSVGEPGRAGESVVLETRGIPIASFVPRPRHEPLVPVLPCLLEGREHEAPRPRRRDVFISEPFE